MNWLLNREIVGRLSIEPRDWWRMALPPFVITFLFALSVLAGRKPSPLLLLPLLLAIGLVVIVRTSGAVLPALLLSSLTLPFSIGTGTGTRLNPPMLLLAALAIFSLLATLVRHDEDRTIRSSTLMPLIALTVVGCISLIVGQLPWFPFATHASLPSQLGGYALFVFSALAFILTGKYVRNMRWLEIGVWLFLGIGFCYLLAWSMPRLRPYAGSVVVPGANGSLFWIWMAALAGSQLLVNRRLRTPVRLALLLLLGALFFASYVQNRAWKSGWLPPLITVYVLITLWKPRLGLFLGVAGILPVMRMLSSLAAVEDYSLSTRVEAWVLLLSVIKESALFGVGPANYYFYTPLLQIRGYAVNFNSHNQYVDLLAQVGVLGLLAFLWFFLAVAKLGWQLRSQVTEGFAKAYVYGALAGLVGMLVAGMLGDWVIPFVYNVGFDGFRASVLGWLFLGGLAVIDQIHWDGESESPPISKS